MPRLACPGVGTAAIELAAAEMPVEPWCPEDFRPAPALTIAVPSGSLARLLGGSARRIVGTSTGQGADGHDTGAGQAGGPAAAPADCRHQDALRAHPAVLSSPCFFTAVPAFVAGLSAARSRAHRGTSVALAQVSGLHGLLARGARRRFVVNTVAEAGGGWAIASLPGLLAGAAGDESARELGALVGRGVDAGDGGALRRCHHARRGVGTPAVLLLAAGTGAAAGAVLGAVSAVLLRRGRHHREQRERRW